MFKSLAIGLVVLALGAWAMWSVLHCVFLWASLEVGGTSTWYTWMHSNPDGWGTFWFWFSWAPLIILGVGLILMWAEAIGYWIRENS